MCKVEQRDRAKNRETNYESVKQLRQEMMAWSRDAAVEVVRSDWLVSIF